MKARKNSLEGLTKEERFAKRKASMTAGDTWEDLHGTKSKPEREFSAARQRQLDAKAARAALAELLESSADADADGAGPSSDGAGPSSDGAEPLSDGSFEAEMLEMVEATEPPPEPLTDRRLDATAAVRV